VDVLEQHQARRLTALGHHPRDHRLLHAVATLVGRRVAQHGERLA
jgi:hypothetical protein